MKKTTFIIVLIINSLIIIAQSNTFTTIVKYPNNQQISSICETKDSGYIAVGKRYYGIGDLKTSLFAIKLNSTGLIVDSIVSFDTTICTDFIEIIPFNNSYLIFGKKQEKTPPFKDSLVIIKVTEALKIINRKTFFLQDTFMITQIQSSIMNNTSFNMFINTFYYQPHNNGKSGYSWLIQMDTAFNILLKRKHYSNHFNKFDIQYFTFSKNINKFVAFSDYYTNLSPSSILFLNDSLEIDSAKDIHHDYHMRYYFVKQYYDSTLLFYAYHRMLLGGIQKIGFLRLSKNYSLLKETIIPPLDTHQVVPAYQFVAEGDGTFYIGMTYNANPYNIEFGGQGAKSWIRIVKYDDSLNILLDKKYGGDAYYFLQSIVETSDKGCIISAAKYNYLINTNANRDIFIMKLDSNGQTTWVKSITIPETTLILYPNPTHNILNISLTATNQNIATLRVYNTLGQLVTTRQPNTEKVTMDVSTLKTGVYFVEGFTRKGERFEGKFVKE